MAKRSEATRYMSDNTINSALRTLGYDTRQQIAGHGFRATAGTLVRELLGWDREVIERHLAHVSDQDWAGVDRKALAFEAEIARLRSEVYPCEGACEALLDAGLALS